MTELRMLLDRWRTSVHRWIGRRFSVDVQNALEFGRGWAEAHREEVARRRAVEAERDQLRDDLTRLLNERVFGDDTP